MAWKRPKKYNPNGDRECARRERQGAADNQMKSHSPTWKMRQWKFIPVWPKHLGERPSFVK